MLQMLEQWRLLDGRVDMDMLYILTILTEDRLDMVILAKS
jgi:hypothetical protein